MWEVEQNIEWDVILWLYLHPISLRLPLCLSLSRPILSYPDIYDGVAPNAKVAFVDIMASTGLVGLSATSLFQPGYNAGNLYINM